MATTKNTTTNLKNEVENLTNENKNLKNQNTALLGRVGGLRAHIVENNINTKAILRLLEQIIIDS